MLPTRHYGRCENPGRSHSILSSLLLRMVLLTIPILSLPWPTQHDASASDLGLGERDCRCCHAQGVPDRHHLLVDTMGYECFECHEVLWDAASQTYQPVVIRDCLVCHTGSLADRHHLLTQNADYDCLSCHAVVWDPSTQSYVVTFADSCEPIARKVEECDDGVDNDGDGLADCADPDCAGTPNCPPEDPSAVDLRDNHNSGASDCTGCHRTNLLDEHGNHCESCHNSLSPTVLGAIEAGSRTCLGCHSPTVHSMGCSNCHGTNSAKDNVKSDRIHQRHMTKTACGVCHGVPENPDLEPTGEFCGYCHGAPKPYDKTSLPAIHRLHAMPEGYFAYSCPTCHGQAVPPVRPAQCEVCHAGKLLDSAQLSSVHTVHSVRFGCTTCHSELGDLAFAATRAPCQRCHEVKPYASTYELHLLHMDKQCWSCHVPGEISARSGTSCGSCHDDPVSDRNRKQVHTGHVADGNQCWVCHSAVVPKLPNTGDLVPQTISP